MTADNNKKILLNVFFIILVCSLFKSFIYQIFNEVYSTQWNISEWLINYQGGFIRRGLRGEFIYQIYDKFGFNPYLSIRIVTATSYILVLSFFTFNFIKKKYPIFLLPFVFFMGDPIMNSFWLKTDAILCLLFIGIMYSLKNRNKWSLILINLFAIIGILMHEIFFVIYIPIVLLVLRSELTKLNQTEHFSTKEFIKPILYLSPTLFAFILVVLNNGSFEMASVIWESWKSIPIGIEFKNQNTTDFTLPEMLNTLDSGLKEGIIKRSGKFVFFRPWAFSNNLFNPLMILFCILGTFFVVTNINRFDISILRTKPTNTHNTDIIIPILFFQLLCSVPLYILGIDYSRWIFFWITSSFTILVLLPDKKLMKLFPLKLKSIAARIHLSFNSIFGKSKAVVYLIASLISFPLAGWWSIGNTLTNGSIYIVLSTISDIIRYLYDLAWNLV